jgi:hypothetical protein
LKQPAPVNMRAFGMYHGLKRQGKQGALMLDMLALIVRDKPDAYHITADGFLMIQLAIKGLVTITRSNRYVPTQLGNEVHRIRRARGDK